MDFSVQTTHPLVSDAVNLSSIEDLILHLIHRKAYEYAASEFAGLSVLDWGCNDGYGLEILQDSASELAGLDSSKQAVSVAQSRLPELANSIRSYDGGVAPFDRSSFDVVTSFQVIEHVSDYSAYFSGIAHVLKPAGSVMFTTPNREIRLKPGMKPWNQYHITEFSASELRNLLCGYYKRVQIFGLHSDPEIEEIEKRRCLRARNAAIRKPSQWERTKSRARKAVRFAIPQPFVERYRRWHRNVAPEVERRILENASTARFQYTEVGLEHAVDLMAICHDPTN
jgi:SAM-dependent methyltransferase